MNKKEKCITERALFKCKCKKCINMRIKMFKFFGERAIQERVMQICWENVDKVCSNKEL